ncbi:MULTISPECIES: hypothetical protein [Streptomyces]|uniref:Uncharacterized protein n=1 Tax=Streptomyces morookaense TaxID=1970 RepID=A0A7Y7E5T4_STRMO|nr:MULTISPECIES: hypothetical protein [Streptomyces]MCC2274366.1 hypothetical protein [Streptomyces sp. ET3-23]NVK76559.1 hypothetical protein [Streptomyces morookaense]GHF07968.1 hypothetical protein GCM10010359_06460 [Streptomyces morookaense]
MRSVRTALALTLGTLATVAAATPALAQQGTAPKAAEARHCVVNVDSGARSCFGTYREAVAFSTHGRVTDAPNDTKAAALDKTLQARINGSAGARKALAAAQSDQVLATIYADKDFGGDSVNLIGSSCGTRFFSRFGADMNDRVSSVNTGACRTITLYQHADFLGFSQSYSGAVPYVGDTMNDQASSATFSN